MVDAFYANTTDEGGALKSLKIHPTKIVFGKFNLVRERHSDTYFCDSFAIPYDAFFKIKEVSLV